MSDFSIAFDKKCTELSAIKLAAYKLTDICSVDLSEDQSHFLCNISFVKNTKSDVTDNFEQTFRAMVLDEELREKIGKETEPLRNLILSYAFSRTGLTEDG